MVGEGGQNRNNTFPKESSQRVAITIATLKNRSNLRVIWILLTVHSTFPLHDPSHSCPLTKVLDSL